MAISEDIRGFRSESRRFFCEETTKNPCDTRSPPNNWLGTPLVYRYLGRGHSLAKCIAGGKTADEIGRSFSLGLRRLRCVGRRYSGFARGPLVARNSLDSLRNRLFRVALALFRPEKSKTIRRTRPRLAFPRGAFSWFWGFGREGVFGPCMFRISSHQGFS